MAHDGSGLEALVDVQAVSSKRTARLQDAERRLFAHYGLDVRQRYLTLANPPLRLRVLETGDGPPVLFLHAVGTLAAFWAPLLPHLQQYRAIAVDLPGHGLSTGYDYRGVNLRQHAVAVLGSLLDALGLAQAPLVGNSLGGMFALWLALDAPEHVPLLVVVGAPGVALAGTTASLGLAAIATPGINRLLLRAPLPRAAHRFALAQAAGSAALQAVPPEMVEVVQRAAQLPGYALAFSTLMERLLRFRTPRPENVLSDAELRQFRQRIHFIWGSKDVILTPEVGRRSIDRIPNASLTIVRGGHYPWFDDARRCGALIASFLTPP